MDERSEFLRPPAWRTRTTPGRLRAAIAATLVGLVLVGGALMFAVVWLLDAIGAPTWIVVLPWLAPTVGLVVWAIVDGNPATLTDDADSSWAGFVVRRTLAGDEDDPDARRSAPVRMIAAALIGAPVTWAYLLFVLAAAVGLN